MRQLTTGFSNICDDVEVLSNVCVPDIIKAKTQSSANREDIDDSLFLCDLGEVMLKHKTWLDVFPQIKARYTVACNKDKMLLKWLIAMGVGFNCATKSEMELVMDLGASIDKIMFGNPCKQTSHIRFAAKHHIKLVAFDSLSELKKMKKAYPEAQLLLNIAVDDSEASDGMNMKYGASINDAKQLICAAVEMNLNVVGISFDIGSCKDAVMCVKAFQRAKSLFEFSNNINDGRTNNKFTVLDIGGDFPGSQQDLSFEQVSKIVNEQIGSLFSSENLQIIGKPGRFYAESAFTACTSIIAKKDVNLLTDSSEDADKSEEEGSIRYMYYISDGIYGCFNVILNDQNKFVPAALKKPTSVEYPCNVWGPTCDGLDKVCPKAYLPEMDIGDWLLWKDMGAYKMSVGSKFNGFQTTCVHYFISENNWRMLQDSVNVNEEQNTILFKDEASNKNEVNMVSSKEKTAIKLQLSFTSTCDNQQQKDEAAFTSAAANQDVCPV